MSSSPHQFTSTPAARAAIWSRMFLCGAGGSGKTYSALAIACALAERLGLGPVHVIDSEHGSALRYAKSPKSGRGFDFIHTPMPEGNYSPEMYQAAMWHVIDQGARIVLIDSISHEWEGSNGCLEHVDRIADAAERAGKKPDNFSAWRTVTPMHRRFLETILSLPAHVICTIRAKTKYESKRENGRMKFEKAGEGPIQREGIEYEPDVFGWMADSMLTIDKTRCDRLEPGSIWAKPGADVAGLLADWIEDAEPRDEPQRKTTAAKGPAARHASPAVPPELLRERARWHKDGGDENTERVLAASPDPADRALVFRWRIAEAKDVAALAAVQQDIARDPHDEMRADMLVVAESRRKEIEA